MEMVFLIKVMRQNLLPSDAMKPPACLKPVPSDSTFQAYSAIRVPAILGREMTYDGQTK
jgi:hypothetical protein